MITTFQVLPNDDGSIELQPVKGRDPERDVEVVNDQTTTGSVKVIKNTSEEDTNA
jgi:hypothetical protein